MHLAFLALAVIATTACSSSQQQTAGGTRSSTRAARQPAARDVELERRVARLELRVLEKETQVEELERRLDDARDEVVRTMAKLQMSATRAEAASAMAEADVAVQTFRASDGARGLPEMGHANRFVQQSTVEFNKENYGGALYLANQARNAASAGRARLTTGPKGAARAGETPFALPIRLKVVNKGNVREGPGTNFSVAFETSAGAAVTGYSYTDEWIRVVDEGGRSGWIFRTLIARP